MNIPLPRPLSVSEVDKLENATLENDAKGDAGWSKSEVCILTGMWTYEILT